MEYRDKSGKKKEDRGVGGVGKWGCHIANRKEQRTLSEKL